MKKVLLIGAGSAVFTKGLLRDMILSGRPWEVRLCDIDPEALETAAGIARQMVVAHPCEVTVTASTDRRDLLPGADAVITTIAVGGRRGWEQDVFIPRKFGVYQPVGDSVLPGGISRALRHVPTMVAIARDIAELCPDAWFFNYSNPMSVLCNAVRQETGVPVIGLCHGVHDTIRYLTHFAGLPSGSTRGVAAGLNHLTWFLQFSYGSESAWSLVDKVLEREGRRLHLTGNSVPLARPWAEGEEAAHRRDAPFAWELYETYGAFPAVLDRHVIEFFPSLCREEAYYGRTPGVDAISFENVIREGDDIYASLYEQAREKRPLDMTWRDRHMAGEQEQLVAILTSLWEDQPQVYSVNLPNTGQVTNLPEGAILESPALVDGTGFHPLNVGNLPEGIRGILARRISSQQLTTEAALSGDWKLLVQALIADGAVVVPEEAAKLGHELVQAHSDFLPQFVL